MRFNVKPVPFKPSRLVGLSEKLLTSHYENNYGLAVRRLNAVRADIDCLDWSQAPRFIQGGLKREELIAMNSMILHEVYFDGIGGEDGLGGQAVEPTGALADALVTDFGSVRAWREQVTGMARALSGESGWVVLTWSPRINRLTNQWANDDAHCLADGIPIVALDLYEHAYHMDFGADVSAYIDAWFNNLHWDRPAARYAAATAQRQSDNDYKDSPTTMCVEDLVDLLNNGEVPYLLDVCLPDDVSQRVDKLPGAHFVHSDCLTQSVDQLPRNRRVVVYCVYGYQVSAIAVDTLRTQGFDACQLRGGIAAWHAIGAPTEPLNID